MKTPQDRIHDIKKILAQIIEGKKSFINTKHIVLRLYNMLYRLGDSEGKKEFIILMQDRFIKKKVYTRQQKIKTLNKTIRLINEGKLITITDPKLIIKRLDKEITNLLLNEKKNYDDSKTIC